ncbi:MAG: restriction endonuclease [Butyrivibrio sp.]|nr:restriction endonuclease [Butyrivibrio sp.]MBP3197703.1 restriction endonuclease [Butyrivibrio sp.]
MSSNKIMYIAIGVFIVLVAVIIEEIIKRLRRKPLPMDEMEGHDFEYYCADLLKKQGFIDVEVTRGSGDFGADILAEKDGITYAVQCKCYDKPIGVKAVQEIYAGRDFYDRMVGVVMTNQYFTQPAVELAQKLKIMLWDRDYVDDMADEKS